MKVPFKRISTIKRIAIMTSGGDCAGLNAAVKAIIRTCLSLGIEPIIIPNGNVGLYNLINFKEWEIVPATIADAENIDITNAGSEIGNSRVKTHKIDDPKAWDQTLAGIQKHHIDALIVCGGDGSGREVMRYIKHGLTVVHIPKTMDLDLMSESLGADSALNKLQQIIHDVKTTGRSHTRILIVEVFGAKTGHIAFRAGVAADADAILLPEVDYDLGIVYDDMKQTIFSRIANSKYHNGTYVIVVAEGLKTSEKRPGDGGATGAGQMIARRLEKMLRDDEEVKILMKKNRIYVPGVNEQPEIRDVIPLYIARSGNASSFDVNCGLQFGAGAVYALLQGHSGITILGVHKRTIRYMQTTEAIERRSISVKKLGLFESMGFCFGRPPKPFEPLFCEEVEAPIRFY